MNIISIIDFINIFIALYLGNLIYSKFPQNRLNRIFLVNSLLTSYAALCEYFSLTVQTPGAAIIWHKASFLWPFFPVIYVKFVLELTEKKIKKKGVFNYLLILPAVFLSLLHLFSGTLYGELVHHYYGWEYNIAPNVFQVFIPLYVFITTLVCLVLIIQFYIKSKGKSRVHIIFIMFAISIPFLTGFIWKALLPRLGYDIPPLNAESYLISIILLSVSLYKQKYFAADPVSTIKQLFATIEDYLIIFNYNQEIIATSRSFLTCSDYANYQILGQKLEKFLVPANDTGIFNIPDLTGKEVEMKIITRENDYIPISAITSYIQNNSKKEILYLLIGRDLRDRKRIENELIHIQNNLASDIEKSTAELAKANKILQKEIIERINIEHALRESEERYRNLVENSPIGIYRTTPDGRILWANPAIVKMLEYSSFEELQKLNLEEEGFSEKDSRNKFKNLLSEKGVLEVYDALWMKKDGTLIYCHENARIIKDENGEALYYEGTVENITMQRKAEKELSDYRIHLEELVKKRTKEFEEVNKLLQEKIIKQKEAEERVKVALIKEKELGDLKTKFISVASHEFRTPLTSIYSSAELLELYGRKWTESKYKDYLRQIQSSVEYMTELINDVLTVSKSDTSKNRFNPSNTNLPDLVNTILESIKITAPENIQFTFNYEPEEKILYIDSKLITQILTNLLSNAVKYSPKGGNITLSIKKSEGMIIMSVRDQGIGIPDEARKYLGDPFYRAENVGDIAGTGLGLSICKRSAELHKGRLEIESKLNEGTIITVFLHIIQKQAVLY